jgi:hypothetical protein
MCLAVDKYVQYRIIAERNSDGDGRAPWARWADEKKAIAYRAHRMRGGGDERYLELLIEKEFDRRRERGAPA